MNRSAWPACVLPKHVAQLRLQPAVRRRRHRAGQGGVWLTYADSDSVMRLDPSTGKTVATIPVASEPRFFDVGAGAVWVMAQKAGALCRIDPAGNRLVGCTVIDRGGVEGGDLTVGDGNVWFRGSDELVAQVDPKSGEVVRRIGTAEGMMVRCQ